jgi:hypothetical protein
MNVITCLADNKVTDLSKLDWVNTNVGLEVIGETLPKKVKVIGQPLLSVPQRISYQDNNFSCNGVECHPRIIIGTQTIYIKSTTKTHTYSSSNKILVGNEGNLILGSNTLPYYSRCYASPGRDDFGIQVGFTTPTRLTAFSYEYVFLPKTADAIRFFRSVDPTGFTIHDYSIKPTAKTDITSEHTIHFRNSSGQVAQFNFRQLKEKAISTYWKIETVTIDGLPQLAVIVGFNFSGLARNATFANDGYFGGTVESDDEQCAVNYLFGARYQNSVGTGNITKLDLYADYGNTAHDYRFGVYSDNAGEPNAILSANNIVVDILDGYTEVTGLSIAVTNALYYWLTFMVSAKSSYIGYGTSGNGFYKSYTYGTLPASVGTHTNSTTNWMMRAYVELGSTNYPIASSTEVTFAPSCAQTAALTRDTNTEVSFALNIDRDLDSIRVSSPGVKLLATVARSWGRTIASNVEVALSSVTNRVFDSIRATTSEITFSPTLSRAWGVIRATTSNLVTSTNLAFQRGWLITSTVGVTLNTTLDRIVSFTRATVSNVSFNPSLVKSWGRTIVSTSNIIFSSNLDRLATFTRTFSLGVKFSTSILSSLAKIYLVIINTGIKLATSITRKIGYTRASNTALSLNPSMVRALAYNRLSSTGIVLTTTLGKIVAFTRSTISNISTALSINRVVTFTRNTVSNIDFLAALIATLGTGTVDYLITIVTNISVAVSVSKSWWSSFLERRFHLSPSTTYGSDISKSGRYGVQE